MSPRRTQPEQPESGTAAAKAARSPRSPQAPSSLDDSLRNWEQELEQLSFSQARTALEVALASLQSDELEVEAMADLYGRAMACLRRCESVLQQVEEDVRHLDPETLEPER